MSDTILGCGQSCGLYCQASWRVFASFTVLDAVLNPGPLSWCQSFAKSKICLVFVTPRQVSDADGCIGSHTRVMNCLLLYVVQASFRDSGAGIRVCLCRS